MVEIIWLRKDLIGGNHLGEERFNWWRKDLIGGGHLVEERFNWWRAFGGGKI